ncbi:30S ribosomal protein S7 [Candidatus Marinamargulisbacteria bacterium SCGC AG-410-N11]|nr:30S ribosomal protein S7 [Candidatus Marinamargulisbacteria bacterium SCGC AG-410-N11]
MSRKKGKFNKRILEGDPVYNSIKITKLINQVMLDGKKSIAQKIVYSVLDNLAKQTKKEAMEAFDSLLKNVMPAMEVKSRRVGGSTYQVPVEVKSDRALALALRWLISNARNKKGVSMQEGLSAELLDAYNNIGLSVKKREESHKMAESNKAFAHFRF